MQVFNVRKLLCKLNIRYLILTISIFVLIFLTGCMDLGTFTKEDTFDEYYSSFGEVVGKYDHDGTVKNNGYDVEKSLFNDTTINHFTWENASDAVEYQEYAYIVIPFKEDLKIESIALFIACREEDQDNVGKVLRFTSFYYPDSSSLPSDEEIKLLTSPNTKIVVEKDDEGNDVEKEVVIEYADRLSSESICSVSYKVTDTWGDGIILQNFTQTTNIGYSYVSDNCLCAKAGSYLYIRVENNSGLTGNSSTACAISFMNLMIRAI